MKRATKYCVSAVCILILTIGVVVLLRDIRVGDTNAVGKPGYQSIANDANAPFSNAPNTSTGTNAFPGSKKGGSNELINIYDIMASARLGQNEAVISDGSGRIAKVSPDQQNVMIVDSQGRVLRSTNVVSGLEMLFGVDKAEKLPIVGDKRVDSIQYVNGRVVVTVGQMVVSVDKDTGQILPLGSD